METGFELTSGQQERSGPETLFTTGGPSYYYSVAGPGAEIIDEGAFMQRGNLATEEVNGFVFNYCSQENGLVNSTVRFYTDMSCVTGPLTPAACTYVVNGLPGGPGGGALGCWVITLDLDNGFECELPQELTAGGAEPIGWSLAFTDPSNTTGMTYTTAPTGYGSQNCIWDASQGLAFIGANTVQIFGNAMDTRAAYPPTSQVGDTLQLKVDVPVKGGSSVTWKAEGAGAASSYLLLVSNASSTTFPTLGGGVATLMVNLPLLGPAPFGMTVAGTDASFSATLPPAIPPTIVAQAVGIVGSASPANVVEASNALVHN